MSRNLIQKNIRLSHEFDKYVSNSPSAYRHIPKGARIVITSANDKKLSDTNISIARNSRGGQFIHAHKSSRGWTLNKFNRATK